MTFVVATFIGALVAVPLVPPGWPRVAYMLTLGSYAACAVVWERRRRLRAAMAAAHLAHLCTPRFQAHPHIVVWPDGVFATFNQNWSPR